MLSGHARPNERLRSLLSGLTRRQWQVQIERCGGGCDGQGGQLTLQNFKRLMQLATRNGHQWAEHEIAELWQYLQTLSSHSIAGDAPRECIESRVFMRFLEINSIVSSDGSGRATSSEQDADAAEASRSRASWQERAAKLKLLTAQSWRERAEKLQLLTSSGDHSLHGDCDDELRRPPAQESSTLENIVQRAREGELERNRRKGAASGKGAKGAVPGLNGAASAEEDRWVDKHGRILTAEELLERARRRLASQEAKLATSSSHTTPTRRRPGIRASRSHSSLSQWTHRDQNPFRYVSSRRSPAFLERYSPKTIFSGMHHKRRVSPKKLPSDGARARARPLAISFTDLNPAAGAASRRSVRPESRKGTPVRYQQDKFPQEVPWASRRVPESSAWQDAALGATGLSETYKARRLKQLLQSSPMAAQEHVVRVGGGFERATHVNLSPQREHALTSSRPRTSSLPRSRSASLPRSLLPSFCPSQKTHARTRSLSSRVHSTHNRSMPPASVRGRPSSAVGGARDTTSTAAGSRAPVSAHPAQPSQTVSGHAKIVRLLTELASKAQGKASGAAPAGARRVALGLALEEAVEAVERGRRAGMRQRTRERGRHVAGLEQEEQQRQRQARAWSLEGDWRASPLLAPAAVPRRVP